MSVNPDHRADCTASGAEPIAAWATRGTLEVVLCAHHLTKHRPRLERDGWSILANGPMTITTAGVGTESTGRHFALEG